MHHLPLKLAALLASAAAVSCQNYAQLAKQLSNTAQIYQPGTAAFNAAVLRWSNYSTPVANVVVVPGTENDVVQTVRLLPKSR